MTLAIENAAGSSGGASLHLRNSQSLGDSVALTAAVRDLHRAYRGRFRVSVETPYPDVWRHNPHVIQHGEGEVGSQVIECRYPLIDYSNHLPVHFLQGFIEHLNRELGLAIALTELRGDIYLSDEERAQPSITQRLFGAPLPYWLIIAGGKTDFTIKWWAPESYQAVVNQLHGRVLFAQVGGAFDHHPKLEGVLDLRGRTSVRELILLVHHAQGVLCPVTGSMHLAAAVPLTAAGKERPCVVVAGGREPPAWEAYPHHTFLHTVGRLPCCEFGGCWRSRVSPLNDRSENDLPENLCERPHSPLLAECMASITPNVVVASIEQAMCDFGLGKVGRAEWPSRLDRVRCAEGH